MRLPTASWRRFVGALLDLPGGGRVERIGAAQGIVIAVASAR